MPGLWRREPCADPFGHRYVDPHANEKPKRDLYRYPDGRCYLYPYAYRYPTETHGYAFAEFYFHRYSHAHQYLRP